MKEKTKTSMPTLATLSNFIKVKILVGISATMCHSAEKIPAKEGCQYKRVST